MLASIGNGLGVWQNHGDMGVANTAQYQTRIPVSTAVDVLPPYAVVRLVSSATDESVGETVWTVAATDEDSDPHVYVLGNKTLTNASGDRGDAMFWPLGRIAYDPADGTPAINEVWGPKAGTFLLRKGYLGFRCAGEADGNTAVFARVPEVDLDDEYPGYGYGSYDDGDGGATWSHDATINIGCDTGTGNVIGDVVRYTHVLFVRRGRPTVSTSLEVLEEDKVIVQTACKEWIDPATVELTCVDGVPTLDFTTEKVRVVVCGVCP